MSAKPSPKKIGFTYLSLCLFIVGIIILITQWLRISAEEEIIRQVNESQVMIIKEIASDLESLVSDVQHKIVIWSKLHPVDQMKASAISHELRIFYELMEDKISGIGIMNNQGRFDYIYPTTFQWESVKKKSYVQSDFFQNALKPVPKLSYNLPYISDQYEQESGARAIPISWPLYAHCPPENEKPAHMKELLAVLVVFLDPAIIDDLCQNHYYHLHNYSSFWLIDGQGTFLSHENKSLIGKNILQLDGKVTEDGLPKLDRIVRHKVLKGHTGTDICLDSSKRCYVNYTPVQLGGRTWSIAVSTPEAKMDHWERRVLKSAWQWWLSIISFILIGLSFGQVVLFLIHKKRINWEKEQKEKFQAAFDGIADLVYMIDIDYNLRIVNKAFKKLCGQPADELEGKKCFQFIKGENGPCPDCPIPKTKATHAAQQLEQIIFHESAHLYAYPLINEEGETTAIVVFARILTKEKMLEEKLQHQERLSLLGELAACLVHEIKNPLVGICMLAQAALGSCLEDSSLREDLERIARECKRLEQLINNLARFSRPAPLCLMEGDIHKALDLSLALLREKLKSNNISLQTDYQKDIPPITHDPEKMQQVFLNLILNAIKAMPQGGKLSIKTHLHSASPNDDGSPFLDRMMCIDIQDTGVGIPGEIQQAIFKPFLSGSLSGTGLGLSIVYSIIQQHGGHIHLKSQPGQGTSFTIVLPLE